MALLCARRRRPPMAVLSATLILNWGALADRIVEAIHRRVLQPIERLAETAVN
jgi:hypothetical protein